jgi:hypothetical protein
MNLWILEYWHKSYRYICIVHEYMSVCMWVFLKFVCACIYICNLLACLCVSIRPFLSIYIFVIRLVHSVSCLQPHTHTLTHSLTHSLTDTFKHSHTYWRLISTHVCAHMCADAGIPNFTWDGCRHIKKRNSEKRQRKNNFKFCVIVKASWLLGTLHHELIRL